VPSSSEHQVKYLENRTFLDTGGAGGPLASSNAPWAAIVAFYAALHLVERLTARQNLHHTPPAAHGQRGRWLRSHPQHRAIFSAYNDLRTASEVARYGTVNQFNRYYPGNTVQTVLIDQKLVVIENYVNAVFQPPGGASGAVGVGPTAPQPGTP
jgi:hypothetical protein